MHTPRAPRQTSFFSCKSSFFWNFFEASGRLLSNPYMAGRMIISLKSDILIIRLVSQKVYWRTAQMLLCVTLIQFVLKTDNINLFAIRTNAYKVLCYKSIFLIKSAQSFFRLSSYFVLKIVRHFAQHNIQISE